MAARNVTLSLPDPLFRRSKVYAAMHDISLSALVAELLDEKVGPEDYETTWNQELKYMAAAPMRVGKINWTREDAHTR